MSMSTLPTLQDVDLALDNRVATLTMRRDDVRNALTGTHLIDDIVRAVEWANADPAVSVLVLTGAGSAFSAGGNVKDMANRGGDFAGDVAEVEERYRRGIQRIPLALHKAEIPLIAAVNGPGHRRWLRSGLHVRPAHRFAAHRVRRDFPQSGDHSR
jgi:enoyl-CoA hydratase/carnithine racemase